ncbi:hypothetical protein LPJ61_002306, partial [Coemansia biformis]
MATRSDGAWFHKTLTVISSVSLFGSLSTIVFFAVLFIQSTHRVDLPLVKLTMVIQSVHAIAMIITIVTNEIRVTSFLLCSSLRYVQYICYLTSIFLACAITIHLWLVITRRRLAQAKLIERWYFIVPLTLAITLSASLATIPSSAYGLPNRCADLRIPPWRYIIIRCGLYYSWFFMASAISFYCMFRVLHSTRQLTHTTHTHGRHLPSSTEAYRNQVNARANSKRLRSLAFYTVAYPVISFVSHFPTFLQELMCTALNRELRWLVFIARCMLYCEGLFMSITFFLYPAVRHSIRDLVNTSVQYWVVDQEEFWLIRQEEDRRRKSRSGYKGIEVIQLEEQVVRDFTSRRGRIYHYILSKTPEGRLVTIAKLRRTQSAAADSNSGAPGGASCANGPPDCLGSESDSDLPDAFSLLKSPAGNAGGCRRKRQRISLTKSASDVVPPSRAEDSDVGSGGTALRVPGELVLAYALRKYYPGRILSQPAPNRFAVEFFDGSRSTLSRGRILTMYESRFYTCSLGGFRLVGDEPAQSTGRMADGARERGIDPEGDFERDKAVFHSLVRDVEAIRGSLDTLHECPVDKIDTLRKTEDRMAAFFGSDAGAKRRLLSRVSK